MNDQERQDREAAYARLRNLITEYLGKGMSLNSPAIQEADQAYREARHRHMYAATGGVGYHHA